MFSLLGTAAFLLLAPGTVAGFVPWWISRWHVHAPFPGFAFLRVIGGLLIAVGIAVLLESFARFALQGLGTPAPVFPTRHLVVKGFYRFVRNPMYVSVLAVLVGEALFLGSAGILAFAACAWLVAHLFVIGYEEPTLLKSFGVEYETYRSHVPRWIPRFSPWRASAE
ncbi:MAG: isoprenylcysteine carboxylmethyltransferase family protein [Silvibacterium sp.]